MSGGYIRLFRKLLQNPIWTQLQPAVLKVAIYFLLRVGHKPSQWYDGKEIIEIPPGSFITSYVRTAEACNISVQQTRDAFSHLSRTGFGTYRRTQRWTMVTVSNWDSYQALSGMENTLEHTRENRRKNRQGTLNKNIRSKEYTPPTPSDEGEEAFSLGEIPFDTLNNSPEENLATKPSPATHHKNGTVSTTTLGDVARSIHARHPGIRRDCGVAMVEKQLLAILKHKHIPHDQRDVYLLQIDANHAAVCASEQWQKDCGEFAKALTNWLAPTKERYDVEVNARVAMAPTTRLMA